MSFRFHYQFIKLFLTIYFNMIIERFSMTRYITLIILQNKHKNNMIMKFYIWLIIQQLKQMKLRKKVINLNIQCEPYLAQVILSQTLCDINFDVKKTPTFKISIMQAEQTRLSKNLKKKIIPLNDNIKHFYLMRDLQHDNTILKDILCIFLYFESQVSQKIELILIQKLLIYITVQTYTYIMQISFKTKESLKPQIKNSFPTEAESISKVNEEKLLYDPEEIEGQCILIDIEPIKLSIVRFILFVLVCILLLGIPLLIVYWYPDLRRYLYYSSSTLQEATDFCVLNYDQTFTITNKQNSNFQKTETDSQLTIYFENRYLKYIVQNNTVKASIFHFKDRISRIAKNSKENGLTQQQAARLRQTYGPGTMIINKPNIITIFFREVFRPLYLFILFSVILWTYEEYYYYAGVIFFTAVISIGISLYETYTLNEKIFDMAYYETQVNILRQGKMTKRSSLDVVPGDIVFLSDPIKIPFEGVILEGSALINECALTGESVPIVKKASTYQSYKNGNIDKSSIVFQGTTLLQANNKKQMNQFEEYRLEFGIPVCVIRTNFVTMKGQLIRLISFPKQRQNTFQKESSKFLLLLFCLSVITYGLLLIKLYDLISTEDIIIKFLDLITITVPPGLPISMTVGIVFALEKMKKQNIFCISPDKVIMGGMVDFVCFDKTGTLTEDYMDFYSFIPCKAKQFKKQIDHKSKEQTNLKQLASSNPYLSAAIINMASNHSVVKLQATDELIGDPMQVKLLQFVQFNFSKTLSNPDIVHSVQNSEGKKIDVYRRFEFDSQLQRMGVIAKSSDEQCLQILMKGSPEMMLKIMSATSIPQQYHETLKKYASMGLRVLAIASKKLGLTQQQIKTVSLDQVETNLQFNGFEIFQNKLKRETHQAITQLFEAEIPCVMITGDNSLTGTNIAYKCGISDQSKNTIIIDYHNNQITEQIFIYHDKKSAQYENNQQNILAQPHKNALYEMQMIHTNGQLQVENQENYGNQFFQKMIKKAKDENIQFTLTGNAFNFLFPGSVDRISNLAASFLSLVRVYARAKPNEKAKIVMVYQSCGKKTAMCGDGANDCGALKQADAGLSLSQAQASISSPFTSKVTNISSMVTLLKQCRAGLVTNFSLFNIMALYSLTQYTSTVICQYFIVYPASFQYLYWDLACNFFFFLVLGYTGTAQRLTHDKPSSSLFTISNILFVLIMAGLQALGQISMILALSGAFAEETNFYEVGSGEINKQRYQQQEGFVEDSQVASTLFLFSNFMYLFSMLAFNISTPWRKHFFTNIPLLIILIIVTTYCILLVICPPARLFLFEIVEMQSMKFNGFILGMAFLFGIVMYANQKYLLQPCFGWIKLTFPQKKWI